MKRRTTLGMIVTGVGIGIAGCLGGDNGEEGIVHVDEMLSESEAYRFDVAEDEETALSLRVVEEGTVDIELVNDETDEILLQDTLQYVDRPVSEEYTYSLEVGTMYTIQIRPDEALAEFTLTAYR